MNVLGIESSCDETSVAVLCGDELRANLISSQHFHKLYGGVVPELSSRAHIQQIMPLMKEALAQSKMDLKDIDLICATAGPGLIGAILVGYTFARGLAFSTKKNFVPVNHIEGHLFSGFLMNEKPRFPILVLCVSGGHTMLVLVNNFLEFKIIGQTIDDAAGEAFDKVAKLIGLGYPGGPKIQEAAERVSYTSIEFPVAQLDQRYCFSFSGVKTSVLRFVQKNFDSADRLTDDNISEIAFAFQKSVIKALLKKCELALQEFEINSISLVGGVAANNNLRNDFLALGLKYKKQVVIPDNQFCGDNAAMIAFRGKSLFENGERFALTEEAFASFYSKYSN